MTQEGGGAVPDFYADAFQVTTTPFGVNMTFSLREPHPVPTRREPAKDVATVRLSPEHAKVVCMMLTRQLRQYERDSGINIAIPHDIYAQLGLAEEDWTL